MDEYATQEQVEQNPPATGALKRWIIEHEDRTSFIIFYVGAAVLLSLLISLFWLVVVVAVHFVLELIRHAHDQPKRGLVWGESMWEVKLDASLVLIALALAVYIPVVFGVLGLATAARAAGAGARFVVWQRVIRGIAISIDDGMLVIRGLGNKLRGKKNITKETAGNKGDLGTEGTDNEEGPNPAGASEQEKEKEDPGMNKMGVPSWRGRWNVMDWSAIVIGLLSVALIVVAPWITEHTFGSMLHEIATDLHPWPN